MTSARSSPARAALREHVLTYSLKRGDFTLKSGAKSNWFLDTKQTACRPDGILLVADAALEIIPEDATAIGGLTVGADPVAYGVAAIAATRGRSLRSFTVRKEVKDHGVTGRIAGALQPGDRVVITEDTVTRGTSLFEAASVVREFGAEPVLITVIVDRGGTCAAMAAEAGIAYEPLLTAEDLGFRSAPDRRPNAAVLGPRGSNQRHGRRRIIVCIALPTIPSSSNSSASASPMPSGCHCATARDPSQSPTGSRCSAIVRSGLTNAISSPPACRLNALPQSASGQIRWNGDGSSPGSSGSVFIHTVVAPGSGVSPSG